jgi:hypothetical protein
MGRSLGRRLAAEGLSVVLHDDVFEQGTPDHEWLPIVGARRWVVLTKDSRLRFRPLEKEALIAANVRVFVFTGGNLQGAAMADAIVKAIPKIKALLAARRHAFVARITAASDVAILLEA